ncbi:MAG: hypothetical protein IPK03_17450 [Bacteroidetes bacterium]|nr:hypothetical protein [Bacteroidota bacterium]
MKKILFLIFIVSIYSCKQGTTDKNEKDLLPLEKLKAGNKRFTSGFPIHPDETLKRIRELKRAELPAIVSCSDSRVPPELIFDQGLGDIFTIRTAGNVIGDYELRSIEYAVEHLHCKLVVVLGHEKCGAIEAFINSDNKRHYDHIQKIVEYIKREDEEKKFRQFENQSRPSCAS